MILAKKNDIIQNYEKYGQSLLKKEKITEVK